MLLPTHIPDPQEVQKRLSSHLLHSVGTEPLAAHPPELLAAAALLARDELGERWVETQRSDSAQRARRIYYLSMEFLVGRALQNALDALALTQPLEQALSATGRKLGDVVEQEPDAGLGNGGLGRLAACFLDSMATLSLPAWGYGMRYEYGMFAQAIEQGRQIERPDPWLAGGTPWEFPRSGVAYPIRFGGWVDHSGGRPVWATSDEVVARAFDMVVPGHGTRRVATLRLWKAAAPAHIDLEAFNQGDYHRAAEIKNRFENISWVLYPNDSTPAGRELRLRQEYFFVSASLQDILARHALENGSFANLADKVAIHLNDTHPAIAVPELMRLLIDVHRMDRYAAWEQCCKVFSYTNHTLMPEALETWPIGLVQHVLPRHLEIILDINHHFLEEAGRQRPGDFEFLRRLSIIEEGHERRVRMAHLCIVGSHQVNGVSQLHSELMRQTIFADFASLYPQRFTNVTNGVTPRRWLAQCNRPLGGLLDETLGANWRLELDSLQALKAHGADAGFRKAYAAAKLANKLKLAEYLRRELGVTLDPGGLFDVQVKRIHEYKRQLLNLLHVITRYNAIIDQPNAGWVPRTVIIAGKAASAYHMAKLIIRLAHDVAAVVNGDVRLRGLLKLVFVPNYGVSVAELIMPAADLSEQISTAGTEASGTGNMKLALNGALTIGTEDGANIEIRDQVGADKLFIFGLTAAEVMDQRKSGYHPMRLYEQNPVLKRVLDQIAGGSFSPTEPQRYQAIVDTLLWRGDHYFLLADYAAYLAAQERADSLYKNHDAWTQASIHTVAAMGAFSSDRSIREYAQKIWNVAPARR